MTDPLAPHAARVSAAQALLDRGFGKPHQTSDVSMNAEHRSFVVHMPQPMDKAEFARYCAFKRSELPAENAAPKRRVAEQLKQIENKSNGNKTPQVN